MPRKRSPEPTPHLVRISGRRSWYIRWSEPGSMRSKIVSTGCEDEGQARLVLADFKANLNAPPPSPTITWFLDERAKDFMVDRADGQSVVESRIRSFHGRLRDFFGDYRPDQLTPALLRQYVSSRPASAARREMEELRASIPADLRPCPFPLPPQRPPRERFMSREEGRDLLDAAHTYHVKLFILIGLTTGQRAGAILDLTWDRVMWDSSVLDFRNPEKGENRKRRGVCPVDSRTIAALQEARQIAKTDRVIEFNGAPVGSIKKAFARAALAAGLVDDGGRATVSPHIMKHSVISWLAMDGWTVDAISDFTSTDEKTVKRIYRKVNPGYLRDLAESLGNGLWGGSDAPIQSAGEDLCQHRWHKSEQKGRSKKTVSH